MTPAVWFDTHAHLDFPEFENDLAAILDRASAAGVQRIITIGTTLEGSLKAVDLADRFEPVYAAVGWHPSNVTSAPAKFPVELSSLAQHPKVVAIGETGLDFSSLPSGEGGSIADDADYKRRQTELFRNQLELARSASLNVIIHQRNAFEEVLDVLKPYSPQVRAVFHCFVGTPQEQQRVSALGSLVSFTGIVTFKNAATVRETARSTPLDGFMLETDCPYLAPVPHRGKRCEPSFVAATAEFIAKERGCSAEVLSEATCRTAREFFTKLR